MIELLIAYAMTFMHTPYSWGGNTKHFGLDCSGFWLEAHRGVGLSWPDMTAQMIHDKLYADTSIHFDDEPFLIERGDTLFFGESVDRITHIAIALNDRVMIESGGAGRGATVEKSKKIGAGVRQRKIRGDLVAVASLEQLLEQE